MEAAARAHDNRAGGTPASRTDRPRAATARPPRGRVDEPVKAKRVIVAIGRSGNFRKLGVPGEELDKVYNRLHDPQEFAGKCVLVVGGGDSALETAIATARAGANVVLSYRKPEFSRPKPDNVDAIKQLARRPSRRRPASKNPAASA
jgi:cation diffusion facilitator CzcD-associated flavoprotein CzcO